MLIQGSLTTTLWHEKFWTVKGVKRSAILYFMHYMIAYKGLESYSFGSFFRVFQKYFIDVMSFDSTLWKR